jgi:sodium/bile acid cotransporter 7
MNTTGTYASRVKAAAAVCRRQRPGAPWLTPEQFLELSREEPWTIVDERSPAERRVSAIPGAVSKEDFEAHLNRYAGDHILVYCTAGCRSGAYATQLRQEGLDAFNLGGGVLAWALNGGPFVTPDGRPTHRVHVHGHPLNLLPPGYEAVT